MGFTRQGNARSQIEKYISSKDMVRILSRTYSQRAIDSEQRNILENSIYDTAKVYGLEHASKALEKYILEKNFGSFTRTNNARQNLILYVTQEYAMETVITSAVRSECERIKMSDAMREKTIMIAETNYFSGDEFAKTQLPVEERKGIIQKAVQWIKERMRMKQTEENIHKRKQSRNIEKNNENQR